VSVALNQTNSSGSEETPKLQKLRLTLIECERAAAQTSSFSASFTFLLEVESLNP